MKEGGGVRWGEREGGEEEDPPQRMAPAARDPIAPTAKKSAFVIRMDEFSDTSEVTSTFAGI